MTEAHGLRCSGCGASLETAGASGSCASCAFELALGISVGPAGGSAPPQIPGYEVRELLGHGGMGTVWLGEQHEPVRRMVAIKLVRAGFDSEEVAARFHSERQALAMLDHPHVARLFDAGTTADGQPYFVMEHVPGVPITQFCNEQRMPVERRVKLFADVCETVHYAHQKGIIHRDLKPSNVLVVDREGRPDPKVIDFGIAKAIRPLLFDHTGVTRSNQILGTPEYMSPEQLARGEVDVHSDVYSLGAILYELLAGARPFDPETMARAGLEEALRTIREVDAPTPSARVTSLGEAAGAAARARATEPGGLASKLRGDLDWITMKALAKEPERRYGSAAALAEDQRRFLRHEPVEAGPPGAAYRARKFVRRNPAGAVSGAVLLLSLVGFAVAMTVQAERVSRERDRANDQAAVSRQVTDFLVDLFWVSDPSEARGNEITAREVLDRGAARIR
jgi:non-specific serine/threonine protein kinase/serine/threonine-protein kinase